MGYCQASLNKSNEILDRLGVETINYAAMMTRIATLSYIEASVKACSILHAPVDLNSIMRITTKL